MTAQLLIDQLANQFEKKAPFACYSLPDSDKLIAFRQTDSTLYHTEITEDAAFIMAPFKENGPAICIPKSNSERLECSYDFQSNSSEEIEIADSKKEMLHHTNLVATAVQTIKKEICEKIVVSRKKKIKLQNFDLERLLKSLLSLYPDAFRYVWYHPDTGLWCGASPEILLISDKNSFKTMALAGTQKINNGSLRPWTDKEITEQKLVTQMLAQRLQTLTSVLRVSKRYTHNAGTLAHIRTDLEGVFKRSRFNQQDLAAILHPTPAVCGTPSDIAMEFILENEGYDRSYYTGYVGTIDTHKDLSTLYVNLRCMQIENNTAYLYVGGGITADSNITEEWKETQHKLQTMAKVIQPFL